MLESELAAILRLKVRAAGGKVVQLMPTEAGVPDRMVLHDGKVYLVELKTDTGALRPAQIQWHRKAAQCGVKVHVLQGHEEVAAWVKNL